MKHAIQSCPLCEQSAEYYFVDGRNIKYYKCPNCRQYQISRSAEKKVIQAPQQLRNEYSSQAKNAKEGFLLVIKLPITSFEPSTLNLALEGHYVPKSELSL